MEAKNKQRIRLPEFGTADAPLRDARSPRIYFERSDRYVRISTSPREGCRLIKYIAGDAVLYRDILRYLAGTKVADEYDVSENEIDCAIMSCYDWIGDMRDLCASQLRTASALKRLDNNLTNAELRIYFVDIVRGMPRKEVKVELKAERKAVVPATALHTDMEKWIARNPPEDREGTVGYLSAFRYEYPLAEVDKRKFADAVTSITGKQKKRVGAMTVWADP